MQCVRFFGTHDHAFIPEDDIKMYLEHREAELGGKGQGSKGKPAAKFAKAIQEIDEAVEVKTGSRPPPLVRFTSGG